MKIKTLHMGTTFETNSHKKSWHPKIKTISALLFAVGVINLSSLTALSLAFIITLGVAISTGLSLKHIGTRVALALPFALFMCLAITFGGGLNPSVERIVFSAGLMLKTITSVIIVVVLMGKQPVHEYIKSLSQVGVPPTVVNIIMLAYRYVAIFYHQVKGLKRALVTRGFSGGLCVSSFKTYGEISGSMFVKSLDRAEAVHKAMLARGYNGSFSSTEVVNSASAIDWFKCGVAMVVIVLISIIDMGMIG
ncbi:cobalt/nickel transport system permease protein [Desulfitispora alkaliphila]|uniref:energy-coupling factor transporter transmembrane component T family protein n=1 Tax=Desulfitispora alkaliphila TaxID=622674 RepID=UPI003D1B4089